MEGRGHNLQVYVVLIVFINLEDNQLEFLYNLKIIYIQWTLLYFVVLNAQQRIY
jgi:hypothetical protein